MMRSLTTVPLHCRVACGAVSVLSCLCLGAGFAGPAGAAAEGESPVFSSDVAPILTRHCIGCHRPGEIAPMSLLSYREARPWARSIQRVVSSGLMPPWFANPEHGTWANDARLSQEEIETIVGWVEGGAKPGDLAAMPEPPEWTEGWQLGEPDYVIELPEVTVPADGPDLFPNQIVLLDLPERRWVRAVEFRPGDRSVNHHQVAFMVDPNRRQEADRVRGETDVVGDDGRFNILAVWAAGTAPTVFPEGAGRWVEPGEVLIMNQHYHPNGQTEQTDRTRIGLFFGEGDLKAEISAILAGETDFAIPAGVRDHRIEARHELRRDSRIVSYFPHMHMRGKRMSFTAIYPDGRREILLDVPEYDFDWQLFYYPEKPTVLPAGSVIEIVAHYDNSADNPDNPDPTRDVGFGLESTDEMMFGVFELIEAETAEAAATGG